MSKNSQEFSRIFSAEYRNLDNVREFVGDAARSCGFPPVDVYHVQAAVDEAFSNIVEHALSNETPESIECTCNVNPTNLVISLSDYGRSFDPDQISSPPVQAPLHQREKGGLGLFFMRHWMDEIHFDVVKDPQLGRQRNVLTMIKKKQSVQG